MINFEYQSILEIWFPVGVSEMSICLLNLFPCVKESSEKAITSSFSIHHWNAFAIVDANSNFQRSWGLLFNFILDSFFFWRHILFIDFKPAFDDTLAHFTGRMVKLSVLNWFILNSSPVKCKVPIFQINIRCSNQFITKNHVIIPNFNFEW